MSQQRFHVFHPQQRNRPPNSFYTLAENEPFRIFFPLGMLLGIIGIALWPLHYAGVIETYPLASHLRLMIHGFLGSFVIGFLFTAGPRLLSCPQPNGSIIEGLLIVSILQSVFAFLHPIAADALFLFQLSAVLFLGLVGFKHRSDLPPPGFILGIAGLLSALVGAVLMLMTDLGKGGSLGYQLSRILLFQAFPVLPIIGIGAFFFPKLTKDKNPQDLPVSRYPSKQWLVRASYAATAAFAFGFSVYLEIKGNHQFAYLLRAATLATYLCLETPLLIRSRGDSSQRLHLIACSIAIVSSFAAIAFYPAQKTAWLHGFFICGLSGAIVLVATRVVFGHSGRPLLALASRKPLLWGILFLAIAASARVFADFRPDIRITHYLYAATFWLVVAAVWLSKVAPKVRFEEPEEPSNPLAPPRPR
ncbi:NnrS family protein [Pelagicoccus mobilis]|uniref:NnrS family protein n=1 Tax=Pelagicoccus mobilis TaxID=415221 RepID=A0A934S0C2_9BACT|nr:NnrS family protein [Pelagicoccus mobilis]MBK1878850.1 NnrS family protein [Pelagicoccus mobilis]